MAIPPTYLLAHTGRDAATSSPIRGADTWLTVGADVHADIVVKGSNAAPALQAAFDSTDGGVKLYPEEFTITTGLTITRNIWVEGLRASWKEGARIINNSTSPAISVTGTAGTHLQHVKLAGFGITGQGIGSDSGYHGVVFDYVNDWTLQNLWIRNNYGSGVQLYRDCWRGNILGCILEGNSGHGCWINGNPSANANGILISGCSLSRNDKCGWYNDQGASGAFNGMHIIGNIIEGNKWFGIASNMGYQMNIANNYFEQNAGTGGLSADVLIGQGVGALTYGFSIRDNYFSSGTPAAHGILVLDAEGGWISGNFITQHTTRNIDIGTTGGGRICRNIACYYVELAPYIAGGAFASRNQGGASIFTAV